MTEPTPQSMQAEGGFRLYWSSRSPFVRKVMIGVHELGLQEQVETIQIAVTGATAAPDLEPFNPLGQIPTLITPEGEAVFDSGVILDYLDRRFAAGRLLPQEMPARLDVLRRQAVAQGIKEKSISWLRERNRAEDVRYEAYIAGCQHTIRTALDAMEAAAAGWADRFDAGHVGLAAALSYLDFRFEVLDWRGGRPALASWFEAISARPSVQGTAFVDKR